MFQAAEIDKIIGQCFAALTFKPFPEHLYDPLRYMISIGGKRIRPRLCLTAYNLFSDRMDKSILKPMMALEVFHCFTLIHDDIMDNSDRRRGQPTVHKKWNNNTAILSGDVMSIEAYTLLSEAPSEILPEVLRLFNDTASKVCEGQQLDMDFEKSSVVTLDEYLKMIGLKTAVLIACSGKMGALIASAPRKVCDAIYDYGYAIGMAFQIMDDYLDTFGDPIIFGKNIGGDIVNNKKSWLLVYSMKNAVSEKSARLQEILAMPVGSDGERAAKIAAMKELYVGLGVDSAALSEIEAYHRKAFAALKDSGLGPQQMERLKDYMESLFNRKR